MAEPTVVFDTNALLLPFEQGLNLDLEVQNLLGDFVGYVPTSVIRELQGPGPTWKAARELAQKYRTINVTAQGDHGVLEAAEHLGAIVVTSDVAFQDTLRGEGIEYIFHKKGRGLLYQQGP